MKTKQNLFKKLFLCAALSASAAFASEPLVVPNHGISKTQSHQLKVAENADNEIGILFLYSESAMNYKGAAFLSQYVAEQTLTFQEALYQANSNLTVKVVGVEPWTYNDLTDLNDLTTFEVLEMVSTDGMFEPRTIAIDGVWPDVMQPIGADYLVVLKTKGQDDNCGASYITLNGEHLTNAETNPFVHVQNVDDCPNLGLLSHEIGHNLGGNHFEGDAAFNEYAYGHSCDGAGTIMWVDGQGVVGDNLFYSTPDILINENVCGDTQNAQMAKLMLDHAPYIAVKSSSVESPDDISHGIVNGNEVTEEGQTISITVSRSSTERQSTVYISTDNDTASSSDYELSDSTLVFDVGVDSLSFDITVTDDATQENDEVFEVGLASLEVGSSIDANNSSITVTIKANDEPVTPEPNPDNGDSGSGGGSTPIWLLLVLGLIAIRKSRGI